MSWDERRIGDRRVVEGELSCKKLKADGQGSPAPLSRERKMDEVRGMRNEERGVNERRPNSKGQKGVYIGELVGERMGLCAVQKEKERTKEE
jgi:hypothetical protein